MNETTKTPSPTTEDVYKAIQALLERTRREVQAKEKALAWLANYIEEGLGLQREILQGPALKAQCLGLLETMEHWNDPITREVKEILEGFATSNDSNIERE